MWRPLEALFSDRWPVARRRHVLERIRLAPVQVRHAAQGDRGTSGSAPFRKLVPAKDQPRNR